MTSLQTWVSDFCQLHERAKQDALDPAEKEAYRFGREELGSVLLVAQRLALGSKAQTRLAIRINQAYPLELELGNEVVKTITHDIAIGGLSTLLATPPEQGVSVAFRLRFSRSAEPVVGRAHVVAVEKLPGSARVALRFDELAPDDRTRLEDAVFDAVVAQLRLLPRRT